MHCNYLEQIPITLCHPRSLTHRTSSGNTVHELNHFRKRTYFTVRFGSIQPLPIYTRWTQFFLIITCISERPGTASMRIFHCFQGSGRHASSRSFGVAANYPVLKSIIVFIRCHLVRPRLCEEYEAGSMLVKRTRRLSAVQELKLQSAQTP